MCICVHMQSSPYRLHFRPFCGGNAMERTIRTAVAATLSRTLRMQIVHLLAAQDIELLAFAESGLDTFRQVSNHRPDLLVADTLLPAVDGESLMQKCLCRFSLPVQPAGLLIYRAEFTLREPAILEEAGVALVEASSIMDTFADAIAQLENAPFRFTAAHSAQIDELLDELGVPEHAGRQCLKNAALICASDERCLHNLSGRLYPLLAQICRMEPAQVERAMRHAIDLAWQSDQFDNQYRIFADTVDAGRGQPTCSEMISRLADILRLEG